jgi:hypothetical protein
MPRQHLSNFGMDPGTRKVRDEGMTTRMEIDHPPAFVLLVDTRREIGPEHRGALALGGDREGQRPRPRPLQKPPLHRKLTQSPHTGTSFTRQIIDLPKYFGIETSANRPMY